MSFTVKETYSFHKGGRNQSWSLIFYESGRKESFDCTSQYFSSATKLPVIKPQNLSKMGDRDSSK